MSVTFGCSNAPHRYVRRPCSSPDMGLTCTPEDRCGYCIDGFEDYHESDAPTVNMSYATARTVFSLAGVHGDVVYGRIPHGNIPTVLRTIMVALNTGRAESHTTPASVGFGALGAKVIDVGTDVDRVEYWVERFRGLLVYAADHGYDVDWS